ncbi:Clp protease N-terminal domain-containing protein [Umezawaea sp.]|uniref:Clp protease N-terminal domain-containing protein n=1 Tax=Umezawaea sp. TaxID=1955258 RepID=UPI002ED193BA
MFARFDPTARRVVVRAGRLAGEYGRRTLDTDFLLLALAEAHAVDDVTADAVRARIGGQTDRELLATLGIDLDALRPRVDDDPGAWSLRRSRLRPLRVTLTGPTTAFELTAQARKAVEVAAHHARRGGTPIKPPHLVLGLLADGRSRSGQILHRLGADVRTLWGRQLPRAAA